MKLKASTEARAYLRTVKQQIRKTGWLHAPTSPKVGKHRHAKAEKAVASVGAEPVLDAKGRLTFAYPPKHGTAYPPTKKELEQATVPHAEHMGLASGTEPSELVDALAAGILGVWDGAERSRAAQVSLYKQANPEPVQTAKPGGEGRALAVVEIAMPGGHTQKQVESLAKSLAKHLSAGECQAAEAFADLAETALRTRVTSSRAYTGAPYTGGNGDMDVLSQAQANALAELQLTFEMVGSTELCHAIYHLILGYADEKTGRPMTLEEYGRRMQPWGGSKADPEKTNYVWKSGGFVGLRLAIAALRIGRRRARMQLTQEARNREVARNGVRREFLAEQITEEMQARKRLTARTAASDEYRQVLQENEARRRA